MKADLRVLKYLIGCATAMALASAAAQGPVNGAATVIRLNGAARISSGNFVWHPIRVGDVLSPGTIIQTSADPGSYIDLALGDAKQATAPQPIVYQPSIISSFSASTTTFHPASEQNTIRLWGDGVLAIDRLTIFQTGADLVTETQLDLKRGHITANVKKFSAASKYEIKFDNGVAGVRGSLFDLQAAGIVKVYIGSLIIAWVNPKTQVVTTKTITGGQAYDPGSNQVFLLSTGSMDELGELSSTLTVNQPFPTTTTTTLAADKTVIGMSPVGANPATLPTPSPGN